MSGVGTLFFVVTVDVEPEVRGRLQRVVHREPTCRPSSRAPASSRARACRRPDDEASPRYAAVYEVEHDGVLDTPELAAIRGFGRFAEHTSNHARFWFRSVAEVGGDA